MLIADRYERIVELVNERGSIRVSELSTLCQVTEETIRRDLDRLEKAGGCYARTAVQSVYVIVSQRRHMLNVKL